MAPTIFGYIRFSYLGRSDVKSARSITDIEARKQLLFSEDRLEDRFYFFEKICLPSLRWQTDPDFRVAIFTSPELPAAYQQKLAMAVADIPQLEIVYSDAPHINEAIDPWIKGQESVHTERTLHFRLDDDDALSSDFIATLRQHMNSVPDRSVISRPAGLFLMNSRVGPQLLAKFEPYIAIGFALVNGPGHIHNPYALRHDRYYRRVPSLLLPEQLAYIHTAHLQSDTIAAQGRKLASARAEHNNYYGDRPFRFAQAVQRQFGGKKPRHFAGIMRGSPSHIAARTAGEQSRAADPSP